MKYVLGCDIHINCVNGGVVVVVGVGCVENAKSPEQAERRQ